MNAFSLHLLSAYRTDHFDDVVSFTGKGEDGQFGILPNAERRVYTLSFGLARFRHDNGRTEYLALPGGVLYFRYNGLFIATRNYVRSDVFQEINGILEKRMKEEEASVVEIRRNLHEIDQEFLRRLSKLDSGWDQ